MEENEREEKFETQIGITTFFTQRTFNYITKNQNYQLNECENFAQRFSLSNRSSLCPLRKFMDKRRLFSYKSGIWVQNV